MGKAPKQVPNCFFDQLVEKYGGAETAKMMKVAPSTISNYRDRAEIPGIYEELARLILRNEDLEKGNPAKTTLLMVQITEKEQVELVTRFLNALRIKHAQFKI